MSSSASLPSSNTKERQSLKKRPLIRITSKRKSSKKELSITKLRKKGPSSSSISSSLASLSPSSLSGGPPSILTKQYSTAAENNNKGSDNDNGIYKNNDDDYQDDPIFTKMLEKYVQETMDDVHEVIFTMQSLICRHSAAICTFVHETNNGYIPFVLKPMVQHALYSTCSSSALNNDAVKKPSKLSTSKVSKNSNHLSSAYVATELNVDLRQLDAENKIRMIQLHGMKTITSAGKTSNKNDDSSKDDNEIIDNDQNIAILFMKDFIDGIYDACAADNSPHNTISVTTAHESSHRNQLIISLFIDCILQYKCNGLYVDKNKLCSSFESAWMKRRSENCTTAKEFYHSIGVNENTDTKQNNANRYQQWIDYLVHIQLLLPRSSTSYFFTLPKMGLAARAIMEGRMKVIQRIQRSQNKEIRRKTLEQMAINLTASKLSCMTGSFHVRDLIASGVVKVIEGPSGEEFIRLCKQ